VARSSGASGASPFTVMHPLFPPRLPLPSILGWKYLTYSPRSDHTDVRPFAQIFEHTPQFHKRAACGVYYRPEFPKSPLSYFSRSTIHPLHGLLRHPFQRPPPPHLLTLPKSGPGDANSSLILFRANTSTSSSGAEIIFYMQ
jgi:hypothetical protein